MLLFLFLHKKHLQTQKNDGTANRFEVCCAVFKLLIFAVPLGDTLGAFDASLDIGEYEHDVIQLVG